MPLGFIAGRTLPFIDKNEGLVSNNFPNKNRLYNTIILSYV